MRLGARDLRYVGIGVQVAMLSARMVHIQQAQRDVTLRRWRHLRPKRPLRRDGPPLVPPECGWVPIQQ